MDRISRLPDEILVRILDYLPTKCAVVTSILSTRWRYLFQLTTNLRFDDERLGSEVVVGDTSTAQKINSRKRRFKKFVYNVLGSHQVSAIKLFSLKTHLNPYSLHHYAWINAAIFKQVQELYLRFQADDYLEYSFDDLFTFPLSLFNSKTLVVLQIDFLINQEAPFLPLEVPTSISLPSLKSLHLKYIKFCDSKSGKRFFSGCFSLEELTLENCRMERKEARDSMHSNTLKKFTVIDMISEEWIDIDAPSLAYMTIDNSVDWYITDINDLASKLVTLVHSVTHLSLLRQTLVMTRYCGLPIFPNVAWLELGPFDFDAWKHILYLLDISQRLETIIFREGLLQDMKCIIDLEEDLGGEASNSWHVGFIEVYKFTGNENEMGLLKLFLRNAKHLKCLTLHKHCRMKMKDELQMAKELLILPRASKYCHVQLF